MGGGCEGDGVERLPSTVSNPIRLQVSTRLANKILGGKPKQ